MCDICICGYVSVCVCAVVVLFCPCVFACVRAWMYRCIYKCINTILPPGKIDTDRYSRCIERCVTIFCVCTLTASSVHFSEVAGGRWWVRHGPALWGDIENNPRTSLLKDLLVAKTIEDLYWDILGHLFHQVPRSYLIRRFCGVCALLTSCHLMSMSGAFLNGSHPDRDHLETRIASSSCSAEASRRWLSVADQHQQRN